MVKTRDGVRRLPKSASADDYSSATARQARMSVASTILQKVNHGAKTGTEVDSRQVQHMLIGPTGCGKTCSPNIGPHSRRAFHHGRRDDATELATR